MIRVLFFLLFVLFSGVNAFAGNGDLTVKGNLKVGDSENQSVLELDGTILIKMNDGKTYTLQIGNLDEDVYGSDVPNYQQTPDECDGDIEKKYTCPANVAKTCIDAFKSGLFYQRTIVCKKALMFVGE